ncbi:MAG: superoxide dismutase [Ni] [Dehalococcoidia bacterium]
MRYSCGIYDPRAAVSGLTVIRMVQLIDALPMPDQNNDQGAGERYAAKMARYTGVKEEHAKIAEHEQVVLWTDYFRPGNTSKISQPARRLHRRRRPS